MSDGAAFSTGRWHLRATVAPCVRVALACTLLLGARTAEASGTWQGPSLLPSTLSPFPLDSTAVVLVSRHIWLDAPLSPDSLIGVTLIDSLLNPTEHTVRLDLGLVSFPALESDSALAVAAPELRWNDHEVSIALASAPPRDWRARFGQALSFLPQARLSVASGRGVLTLRARIGWTEALAYGRLERQSLAVNLAGTEAWAGRPSEVYVEVRPRPLELWLDYLESTRAHGRAVQARPAALPLDEQAVRWRFQDWEPGLAPFAPDRRLMLVLEPNEVVR